MTQDLTDIQAAIKKRERESVFDFAQMSIGYFILISFVGASFYLSNGGISNLNMLPAYILIGLGVALLGYNALLSLRDIWRLKYPKKEMPEEEKQRIVKKVIKEEICTGPVS